MLPLSYFDACWCCCSFKKATTAATVIYVSLVGNDAYPGTAAQPVATPQGAQTRVRSLIAAGLTDAVEVRFAAGTYRISAPLELGPQDSGAAAFSITWKAAAGATVILSGGRTLTGTWVPDGGGIWRIDVPGVGYAAGEWNFRQLFVSGQRATRARFPNVVRRILSSTRRAAAWTMSSSLPRSSSRHGARRRMRRSTWCRSPDSLISGTP